VGNKNPYAQNNEKYCNNLEHRRTLRNGFNKGSTFLHSQRDSVERMKLPTDVMISSNMCPRMFASNSSCTPKHRYETAVETWREVQSYYIEFTMKRLREPTT
jgi:hypothetical protein